MIILSCSDMSIVPQKLFVRDDGKFPNNSLPVLLYKGALKLPLLFSAGYVKNLFRKNGWTNAWDSGIFRYHHYHSNTHEALGIYKGRTILQFGGEQGVKVTVVKGDVLVIPAGVAHRNLGKENDVRCIGAYPEGIAYDMNYGKEGERPRTDKNIAAVSLPVSGPLSAVSAAAAWRPAK